MSWYAARRRPEPPRVRRLQGQPQGGFASIGEAVDWLVERGHIGPAVDDGEGVTHVGWGDPFCVVAASRNDPWEAPPQLELL